MGKVIVTDKPAFVLLIFTFVAVVGVLGLIIFAAYKIGHASKNYLLHSNQRN